jgi:plastocyanin
MKRSFLLVAMAVTGFVSAQAGTISGKVSGASGQSVVYVDAIQGKTFPAPTSHPVIDQKGLMFQPHLTAVQAGTTVDFLNSDTVAHNVFWPSVGSNKKLAHNMGTWPKGEKQSFKFDNPGAVPLLCNVHPEMSAYLVISPTPYFAVTDASGAYKLENVPDGSYTVVAWHEGTKGQTKPVSVAGDTKADFSVSK